MFANRTPNPVPAASRLLLQVKNHPPTTTQPPRRHALRPAWEICQPTTKTQRRRWANINRSILICSRNRSPRVCLVVIRVSLPAFRWYRKVHTHTQPRPPNHVNTFLLTISNISQGQPAISRISPTRSRSRGVLGETSPVKPTPGRKTGKNFGRIF